MWEHAGIVRDGTGLRRALADLDTLSDALQDAGIAPTTRVYNMSWHEWLNVENLLRVSRIIVHAALAREESRGAHFRSDSTATGPLEESRFSVVSADADGTLHTIMRPVDFSIVRPGESLLDDA